MRQIYLPDRTFGQARQSLRPANSPTYFNPLKTIFVHAHIFLLLVGLMAFLRASDSVFAQSNNLLSNPSFDNGLIDWTVSGDVVAQNSTSVLTAQSSNVWLMTDYVAVVPKQLFVFSTLSKAENILDSGPGRRASISFRVYRADMSYIRQYVVADFSGDFDWKEMAAELRIPPTVAYVRVIIRLYNTSGVLRLDDAFATLYEKPAIDLTGVQHYPNIAPTISRRGAIVGVQWFNTTEVVSRFQEANFNFAWSQGSYLNQKMQYQWRTAFTASEETMISEWMSKCAANGINCYLSVAPRGQTPSNAMTYSSSADITLLVDKFEDLYALGVRHFGLNFDDLRYVDQDKLLGADVGQFNNLGEAHAYFVNEIYTQFILTHADSDLMIVPLDYAGIGNLGSNEAFYLTELGTLPLEIGMVSTIEFVSDAQAVIAFTGRPHVVWDNQFAYAYERSGADEYIAPLFREVLDQTLIDGYAFLPLIPTLEDTSLVSWRSAADYAWSPERYDAERSFQLAVARYQGVYDDLPIEGAPGPVTQVAPLQQSNTSLPTYVWRPEPLATQYTLVVYNVMGQAIVLNEQLVDIAAICTGTEPTVDTCSYQPTQTLVDGLHTWLIMAANENGDGPWSNYTP